MDKKINQSNKPTKYTGARDFGDVQNKGTQPKVPAEKVPPPPNFNPLTDIKK